MKHVFVVGMDDFNMDMMRALPQARDCRFHELYSAEEVKAGPEVPITRLLLEGLDRLHRFSEPIDAIVGYWDFPVSTLLPLLRQPFGLPSPTLEAVLKCEHKYWCRLEQKQCVAENAPAFCVVDPFADNPLVQVELEFPFWLKPIKSVSSHLGFRVNNRRDFNVAIECIRAGIGRFAEPFNYLLNLAGVPEHIARVDGWHCLAESIISQGSQCTLEGYVHRGEVVVYGIVDSIRSGRYRSSFSRYQYPSRIPKAIQAEMADIARRLMQHIDLDNSPFNIEFFWDKPRNRLNLLEVNPRISQSHSPLFEAVDGASHHQVMLELARGRKPDFPQRQGHYRHAAKFMWRVVDDAVVGGLPSPEQLAAIERRYPSVKIRLDLRPGMRLSELNDQDSYSYELAAIYLGADSQSKLLRQWESIKEQLNITLLPV